MWFIEARTGGEAVKNYHTAHLTRDNYFGREGQVVGIARGRAAELLGMPEEVSKEQYFRLIDGQHPMTGEKLGGRNKKDERVAYEVTSDIPKPATLAARLGGDRQIIADFHQSSDETCAEMEDDMRCRVRKGGQNSERITGNALWISYPHHVTRNLEDGTNDPHEHEHLIFPNKTFDPVEKDWKACEWGAIKTDALYYQSAFHARLAKRLADRGYPIEQDGKSFTILSIDKTLSDKFSRRTKQVEDAAEKLGITNDKIKSKLGRRTRGEKNKDQSLEESEKGWLARCTPDEIRQLKQARFSGLKGNQATAKESVDYAIAHCFQNEAVVSEKRLWAEALMHGVGSVLPDEIQAEFKTRKNLLYAEEKGRRQVTTVEWRQAESRVVSYVREGRGTCKKLMKRGLSLSASLDAEQRAAAELILNSRDRVMVLNGAAGAGKTYTMEAIREVIEKSGKWGGAYALSVQASRKNLREAGFIDADTTARLATDEKLQRSLAGKVVFIDEAGLQSVPQMNEIFTLAEKYNWRVILAGDVRQHGPVEGPSALKLMQKHSGVKIATLEQNRRQITPEYRSIADNTRSGNEIMPDGKKTYLEHAVEEIDKLGWLVELPKEEIYHRAAQDYLDATAELNRKGEQRSGLLVTTTHAEGAAVSQDIRAGKRDVGQIDGKDHVISTLTNLEWSKPQKGHYVNYEPGVVVQFDQNVPGITRGDRFTVVAREGNKVTMKGARGERVLPLDRAKDFQVYRTGTIPLAKGDLVRPTKGGQTKPIRRNGELVRSKIENGDVYKVAGFTKTGDIICDNGFVIPKDFAHLRNGDTLTSMSSQSRTVDWLSTVITEQSMAAANLEQIYVTLSRGKEEARVYTDNKEALLEAIKHSSAKRSATELIKSPATQATEDRRGFLQELRAKHHIRRVYKAVKEYGQQAATWAARIGGRQYGGQQY